MRKSGEITAVGYIGEAAWGVSNITAGTIMVVIVVILTVLGGLMGVAVTDMIMFFCMIFSVTMVFPGLFTEIGGWAGLREALGENAHLVHPTGGMGFWKAVMLVVFCFSPYADPTFYQRFSASSSPKVGTPRPAHLLLYLDRVRHRHLHHRRHREGPSIRRHSPRWPTYRRFFLRCRSALRALFIVGLVGAIISTLDSYYLVGGTTLANDIYARARGHRVTSPKDDRYLHQNRCGSTRHHRPFGGIPL